MKGIVTVIAAASVIAVILAAAAPAQQVETRTMRFHPDSVFIVPGLGAVVEPQSDTLCVTTIPPADMRPDGFNDVDLRQGDRLLMANGKRLRTIAGLKVLFEETATGDTIKLGLKRGNEMMITPLIKREPDPGSGPVVMMHVEAGAQGDMKKSVSLAGPGGVETTVAVLDGGLVIGPGGDGLAVVALLPGAAEKLSGELPEPGARLISINGEAHAEPSELQTWYDNIPSGDSITVVFEQGGTERTVRYVKTRLKPGRSIIEE
jgi:hypothetical protein